MFADLVLGTLDGGALIGQIHLNNVFHYFFVKIRKIKVL
jgi:hypothetical protein